jgi:uncharacterized membrane protein YecN with MAPEG domain
MSSFQIPSNYSWVLFSTSSIAFHVLLIGFRYGAGGRSVFRSTEFKEKAQSSGLLEDHKKATGDSKLPGNGYPDTGNGRFSDLLSYGDWLKMNQYQRCHMNYVEGLGTVITLSLIAGLYSPKWSVILGFAYILGREVYAYGYSQIGANARMIGAIIFDIALVGLAGIAFRGAFLAGNGIDGLVKLLTN